MDKYELVPDMTMELPDGRKLYRIRALKDFDRIKTGDIGGYVESEANLSQDGCCWISDDALVIDNARVEDDAQIGGNAKIYHNAVVKGNAEVFQKAEIFDNAVIQDGVSVYGKAKVFENAHICGENVCIERNAMIYGDTYFNNDTDDVISITFDATIPNEKFIAYSKALGDYGTGGITFYSANFDSIMANFYEDGHCYIDYFPYLFANAAGLAGSQLDAKDIDKILAIAEQVKEQINVTNVPRPQNMIEN